MNTSSRQVIIFLASIVAFVAFTSGHMGAQTSTAPSPSMDLPKCTVYQTTNCQPYFPPGKPSSPSGRPSHAPQPGLHNPTSAELEAMRYGLLFSEIDAQEKMAQTETAAGHADAAASWHSFLSTQSGLAPESAEIVKKISAEYLRKAQALQQERIRVTIAVRHANPGAHMSRFNSPEIAKVEQEIDALLPSVKIELIQALGPKVFTQLDSYTIHSHDRARKLDPSATGPSSSVPNVGVK